jgi:hypothetical protein
MLEKRKRKNKLNSCGVGIQVAGDEFKYATPQKKNEKKYRWLVTSSSALHALKKPASGVSLGFSV